MSDRDDPLFQSLASAYVEREGALLKSEMEMLDRTGFQYPASLDERIARRIKGHKRTGRFMKYIPVAACLMLVIGVAVGRKYSVIQPSESMPAANAPVMQTYTLEFVSARLPENYSVTGIDYDNEKAVYYIENNEKNEIVMTVEASGHGLEKEGLHAVSINGTNAYGISKADYCLLTYEKDGSIYTISSRYNHLDLIAISANFF